MGHTKNSVNLCLVIIYVNIRKISIDYGQIMNNVLHKLEFSIFLM